MDVMYKSDADAEVHTGRLELIASRRLIRRGIANDPVAKLTSDLIMFGLRYCADVLSYTDYCDSYTWYGRRVESTVCFYRRVGENF